MNNRWSEASCWLQRSLIDQFLCVFWGKNKQIAAQNANQRPRWSISSLLMWYFVLRGSLQSDMKLWVNASISDVCFTYAKHLKIFSFTLSDHSSFRPPPSVKCMIPVPHTVLCNAESSDVSLHLESGRQNSFIKSEKRAALGIRQSAVVWQSSGAAL